MLCLYVCVCVLVEENKNRSVVQHFGDFRQLRKVILRHGMLLLYLLDKLFAVVLSKQIIFAL